METPRVPRGGCDCVNHPFGESEPPVTPGGVDLRLVPSWVNLELAQVTRELEGGGEGRGALKPMALQPSSVHRELSAQGGTWAGPGGRAPSQLHPGGVPEPGL